MPKRGTMQLHENGDIAIAICNNSYCACKSVKEINVTLKEENCNINSETGEIEGEMEEDGAPVGTVISYMGNSAPNGYLTCDGTVYNISDYKKLAEQIKREFGSYNYFGGDGATTFAVPDLRGEFLRGAGTATRNTGGGADVGAHQDPTDHVNVLLQSSNNIFYAPNGIKATNTDTLSAATKPWKPVATAASSSSKTESITYTSRPTNTSVLYVIKY